MCNLRALNPPVLEVAPEFTHPHFEGRLCNLSSKNYLLTLRLRLTCLKICLHSLICKNRRAETERKSDQQNILSHGNNRCFVNGLCVTGSVLRCILPELLENG
mgnify:CR=1 FL=1